MRKLIYWICFWFPFQIDAFTLITFDVDGTLLKGSGEAMEASAHSRAYSHAVSTIINEGEPIISVSEALPIELYHGSTDGLILLRLAKATLNIDAKEHLDGLFSCMYDFINEMEDDEVVKHISPLPGVLEQLHILSGMKDRVMCGLVTGNVEGIARRKMKAIGIFQIGALAPPASSQKSWKGTEDIGFLGGFGSDYCSGDILDLKRNYMDRG
jgi:FMN phosphatase YigB (HAD superfamily)